MADVVGWDASAFDEMLELAKSDPRQARRILNAIYRTPRAPGGGTRKLEGSVDLWRIRVGDWRVIYRLTTYGIQITEVVNRRDAYR